MTTAILSPAECGMLLLGSNLGDPNCTPLSPELFSYLTQLGTARPEEAFQNRQSEKQLCLEDLMRLGCNGPLAEQVMALLSREAQLDRYLRACEPFRIITRISPTYPQQLRRRLGDQAPLVLYAAGALSLLNQPAVSAVGSRDLNADGEAAAEAVGSYAARHDYVLCSGGARGADRTAGRRCYVEGGRVIYYLADSLQESARRFRNELKSGRLLLLAEGSPQEGFSSPRALHRNFLIHAHSEHCYVCQCTAPRGGTWSGSLRNLRAGWSSLHVAGDGGTGAQRLIELGAQPFRPEDLT